MLKCLRSATTKRYFFWGFRERERERENAPKKIIDKVRYPDMGKKVSS